jgi:hypothetical protein
MNGSIDPDLAFDRSARNSDGQAAGLFRSCQGNADVGSHGSSQAWLRSRISLHDRPSRYRGGRSNTAPAVSSAGQPG